MMRHLFILIVSLVVSICAFAQETPWDSTLQEPTGEEQVQPGNIGSIDWGSIRILDLDTAQRVAVADNPSLQAAEARVRQARAGVLEARSAYLPRLDASASASKVWLSDNADEESLRMARIFDPQAGIDDPEDYYQAGLSASWLLFDGFAREFSNAAARYGEQESEAARLEARRLLLSAVAFSYYGAQLARENIAIAEADEAFNLRQLEDAQARRRVGTGSLSDELNFQVRVNSAKTTLISSKRVYETTLVGLAALMGIPDATFPPSLRLAELEPETAEELASPEADDLLDYALLYRPDVMQSEYALKRTRAGVGAARAEFLPTISLSGSIDGSRANSGRLEEDDFGETVAVSLSYNLFSGGARLARLQQAEAQRAEAEKLLEDAKIAVASEVRQALAELAAAREELVLQRSNAVLVQRNRELVEKEYSAGQASLVRLNEAQRDLTAAQGRLALAQASLRQAWHNLRTATAQTLERFVE